MFFLPAVEGIERAAKQLKGFDKVFLKAGETKTVSFTLFPEDIARFDPEAHEWVADKGTYRVLVGSASDDIRVEKEFALD